MKNHYCLFLLLFPFFLSAQWTNRYPQVTGYGHHVYFEGFELPVLNAGPTEVAPAPGTRSGQLVLAARGWLWLFELSTGTATRLTSSSGVDASPAWSPDGKQLAFVRDDGTDTDLMLLDLATGEETVLAASEKLELDPRFSADGRFLYYASSQKGGMDVWRLNMESRLKTPLTTGLDPAMRQLERQPISIDGESFLYIRKRGFSFDAIEKMTFPDSTVTVLVEEGFASQLAFDLAPDGHSLVYSWPQGDDYELRLLDLVNPASSLLLTPGEGLPRKPRFSADGQWVYYTEFDRRERSALKRIPVQGGQAETLEIKHWDWGVPTAKLTFTSTVDGATAPVRLSVRTEGGHPLLPEQGELHSDGQSGRVFYYSPGNITLEGPAGNWVVQAVQGFTTPLLQKELQVSAGERQETLALESLWDPAGAGWFASDNHFHLNYGGGYQLEPEDLLLPMEAEQLHMAWPMLGNLHNRYLEQDLWGWENEGDRLIRFGQEVRSHFLGHLNLIGTDDLFWPWTWGPGYEVYGTDDRPNSLALQFAREQGALGGYVHPIGAREPFAETDPPPYMPVALTADAVLGEVDLLEVGCLWTDEIGTATFWHRILSLGIPLGLSAGSDMMADYYRTMAIGSTRVYVHPEGPLTEASYLSSLKDGKSFVSNGPLIEFSVAGVPVGGTLPQGGQRVAWELQVHSAVPYETVEVFLNGDVVNSMKGSKTPGNHSYKGRIALPEGGWITARVSGGPSLWPMMDSYPFAESSPIWIGSKGSTHPAARKAAATDLLRALNASESRLDRGYGDTPIPLLKAHFEKARQKLMAILETNNGD